MGTLLEPEQRQSLLVRHRGERDRRVADRTRRCCCVMMGLDIDALLQHGVDLPTMLGAAKAIYGRSFNPVLSLKAVTYFADVARLPDDVKKRLTEAAVGVDLGKIPIFKPVQPPVLVSGNAP